MTNVVEMLKREIRMTNLTGSEINRLGSEAEMLPFVSMTNVVEVLKREIRMTNLTGSEMN